ncbi:MAG: hypothetical protein ACXV5Q_02815 [Frankiaceae bacterium]
MARAELMQRILASRAAAADDVAALRGDLDAVAHGLATLAGEASGLLERTADPEAVAGLTATLQLTPSVLETISAEQLALDRLQRRLRRRTLNVGVIGRGRQGKSRFLQSLTGLSAREIPTSSGGFCTGVPSEIVAGPAASATVEFRTADSFLREVVAPYYEELGLGPAPRTLLELSPPGAGGRQAPELPAGRAALLDELHRLIAAVPRIRHLLGAPPRTIAPEEVAAHVAQADSEGRPLDTYRAVARLRLVAPFPHNEVSQVAVLDLPGLGDTNLTDVAGLLRALSDDVDVLVMVRLPAEKGDDWLDVDYQLYGHAEVALPDVPMDLRAFAVLNVDPKSGNGANARRMCDALPGTRLRFSGAAVVDCASAPEVSAFLDLVLDHLARTGAQADSRLVAARARDVQVVLAQVADVVGHAALVTALQPSAQAARDVVEFGRRVIDELWTALEGLLGELRYERGRPDSVLASAVRVVLDKARDDKGLPSVDHVVERIGRRGSRVGAYSDLLNEARAHLARHFVELDPALAAILDTLRDRLAAVLRSCGRLGTLAPSADARFLAELECELGQVLPEDGVLRDALRTLDGTRLHYRGFLQHRIRACLDALNADRPLYPTKEVADATPTQIRDAVEATYDSALGEVERLLHGVEAEPSEAIFTLGEEFVDRALRSRGAESEWRTVYLHYRNRIWADHFSSLAAGTADMRRWTETLHATRAQAARLAERVDAALTASGAPQ